MKVIMDKGGIQSRAVNDKKNDVIQTQNARSVNRVDRSVSEKTIHSKSTDKPHSVPRSQGKNQHYKNLTLAKKKSKTMHFKLLNKSGVTGNGLQSQVSRNIKTQNPRGLKLGGVSGQTENRQSIALTLRKNRRKYCKKAP